MREPTRPGSPPASRLAAAIEHPLGRWSVALLLAAALLQPTALTGDDQSEPTPAEALGQLIAEAGEVELPTLSAEEHEAAAAAYRSLLERLGEIETDEMQLDDLVDVELLEAHLRTRLFEIEEVRLHELVPVRYLRLFTTSGLFLRPCGASGRQIERAVEELEKLPAILESARANLKRPARVKPSNSWRLPYRASNTETRSRPKKKLVTSPATAAVRYVRWR